MISFKGFNFYFDDLNYRITTWSPSLNISFTLYLTEMQIRCLTILGGNDYPKECLINTMKRHINGYIKYIEEQNEYTNSKI